MNKIRNFISINEVFKSRYILFIKINKSWVKEKFIIKENKKDVADIIYKFCIKKIKPKINTNYFDEHIIFDKIIFDYIVIFSEEKSINRYALKKEIENLKTNTKKGSKFIICARNNQNLLNLIKNQNNQKRKNLTISNNLLLYDYIYFRKFRLFNLFGDIKKIFILNRFYFFASNVMIKYLFVPEYDEQNKNINS